MNGDGNGINYVPSLRHPDPAHECARHSGGESQSPPTGWTGAAGGGSDEGDVDPDAILTEDGEEILTEDGEPILIE